MRCPPPNHWLFSAAVLINRLALGGYFLAAGISKIRGGIGNFVDGPYRGVTPAWLPEVIATPFGYSLPIVETIAGGLMIIGLAGRAAAAVTAMMLVSFMLATGITAEHGPYHTNVILFTLSLLLILTGSGGISLDAVFCKSCRIRP